MNSDNDFIDQATLNVGRVPGERRLSILAVGARQCRWPVADDPTVVGGILCCGAQTDATYCTAHRKLSYADRQTMRANSVPARRIAHAAVTAAKVVDPASREAA